MEFLSSTIMVYRRKFSKTTTMFFSFALSLLHHSFSVSRASCMSAVRRKSFPAWAKLSPPMTGHVLSTRAQSFMGVGLSSLRFRPLWGIALIRESIRCSRSQCLPMMREVACRRQDGGRDITNCKDYLFYNYPSGASHHPLTAAVPLRAPRQNY